jgi:magnesium transporter
MAFEVVKFSYISEFINLPVYRSIDNKRIGKLVDIAAITTQVYPRVTGILARTHLGKPPVYIPWGNVKLMAREKRITVDFPQNGGDQKTRASENEILVCKTFLDKQIISTSGYKIVRVNDLQLLIEDQTRDNTNLWVVHIDIGIKGILRRIGILRPINSAFRWVTDRDILDEFVSWKFVQPTSTLSVYGSVQLKTDASKLSEIHPADMADIIEDLGTEERIALIESLDHFTAAQTIQEMQFKNRLQMVESMEPPKLAPIINEMQVDDAVDLLDACDIQKRQTVYSLMPPEKVMELRELSKLSRFSVGSIMNTDYITAKPSETARTVLDRVRVECEKLELYRYTYIVDDDGRLKGVVSLRNLLLNDENKFMAEIMNEQPISVQIDTRIRRVAKLFFKYNFEAIPVVDEDDMLQGIVSYRDVIAAVYPEIKEEDSI